MAISKCVVIISSFEQNGASVTPTTVSRLYDLVVKGTANPNATHMSGNFKFKGTDYPVTVIGAGMNWTATIPKGNYADVSAANGQIVITKTDFPGCNSGSPLTFV